MANKKRDMRLGMLYYEIIQSKIYSVWHSRWSSVHMNILEMRLGILEKLLNAFCDRETATIHPSIEGPLIPRKNILTVKAIRK